MKSLIFKIGLALTFFILSIFVAIHISETYFFDKFYYQKSLKYGYWQPETKQEDFGIRAQDIIQLQNQDEELLHQSSINTDIPKENTFTIAIISDSYAWGAGVKNHDRYPVILEKKLDKLYPTQVLSLSMSGDNFIDNYVKYHLTQVMDYDIDLYIFGLVGNDLLLNEGPRYDDRIANQFLDTVECQNKQKIYDTQDETHYYHKIRSFSPDYANLCIFHSLIPFLPKDALYFEYGNSFIGATNFEFYTKVVSALETNGMTVLSPQVLLDQLPQDQIHVSPREFHPSKYSHHVFADFLFQEITTNPKWNFPVQAQ